MAARVYRFGEYRIDVAARELLRAGDSVAVAPIVFDCLAYLLEHRDRAVGRDELIAAVWGKIDAANDLPRKTMLKVRRAVGDVGDEQRVIRTVPRFGYRWVAEIETEGDGAATATTVSSLPTPATASARSRRRMVMPALVATLGIAAIAGMLALLRSRPYAHIEYNASSATAPAANAAASASTAVIAVLPIEVAAGSDEVWLKLGLMDLIAARLREAGLPVLPSETVIRFVGDGASANAAAATVRRATGTREVVRAQARQANGGWLVQLRLDDDSGTRREAQAQAADAIAAGREAADRLLAALGKQVPTAPASSDLSLATILQRSETAWLVGDLEGARRLIDSAPPALRARPELRHRLAQIDFRAGRYQIARDREQQLLQELSAESNPALRARVLISFGSASKRLGEVDGAQRAYAEAIALLKNRHEPEALGQAYAGRAIVHMINGRYEEASADYSTAEVSLNMAGDVVGATGVEHNLGMLDIARGRHAEALPLLERVSDRLERLGDIDDLYASLANQIVVHRVLLDAATALAVSDRAEVLIPRLNDAAKRRELQAERASALAASGRISETRTLLAELDTNVDGAHESAVLAQMRALQAELDLAVRPEAAVVSARQAIAIWTTPIDARDRAVTWLVLIRGLRRLDRHDETVAEIEEFSRWAKAVDHPTPSVFAAVALAEQAWSEHRPAAAMRIHADALDAAERQGIPADIAETTRSYGGFLIAGGYLAQASAVVGRIARWAQRDFDCALLQAQFYRALGQRDAWQAALTQARALAGERPIPNDLATLPALSNHLQSADREDNRP
jgi:DNA-binding winged helix-turn-helix (wHTH) protein/tetratricopeptide (TPR) repeat protein